MPLDADLEILAPSANVNAVLMTNFKTYTLQTMTNELSGYLAQADATYFALTDKSTPIGQFTYKKKRYRHHRKARHANAYTNTNNNSDNIAPPPPYYNEVSGQ